MQTHLRRPLNLGLSPCLSEHRKIQNLHCLPLGLKPHLESPRVPLIKRKNRLELIKPIKHGGLGRTQDSGLRDVAFRNFNLMTPENLFQFITLTHLQTWEMRGSKEVMPMSKRSCIPIVAATSGTLSITADTTPIEPAISSTFGICASR